MKTFTIKTKYGISYNRVTEFKLDTEFGGKFIMFNWNRKDLYIDKNEVISIEQD
jgi:hypothetical protein